MISQRRLADRTWKRKKEQTEQIKGRQAVRTMLATLKMADVDDNELHDLTLRISHTGKL